MARDMRARGNDHRVRRSGGIRQFQSRCHPLHGPISRDDAAGYFQTNKYDAYSLNNMIMPGWNDTSGFIARTPTS
jgi:hypothetical protein